MLKLNNTAWGRAAGPARGGDAAGRGPVACALLIYAGRLTEPPYRAADGYRINYSPLLIESNLHINYTDDHHKNCEKI